MNNLVKIKAALLFVILTTNLGIYSSVQADTNRKIGQNQQYIKKQSTSQELWQRFRQRQDEIRLQQQHRIEQFSVENQLRQQQFEPLVIDRLRQQQRQELETFRLQQKLRNPQ
ncbi:hypothetical protein [Nostoc sp. PCC 7107]|uniref:hypothetical protein n=1 Tax=Nostoc sp. PCC 7107 TaxID=317936 RepID=UPI00029EC62F|nr:hypothetical protein [Nostoc sp. PCC 7107]AFY44825.1 TOX high mobility group box family member 3 [Nostoc sp. PCC 7107]